MVSWILKDDNKGRVSVAKNNIVLNGLTEKCVYKKKKTRFNIHYNEQYSTVGYSLTYTKGAPKFVLFNSFFIANCGYNVAPEKLKFDIIYEDQAVRLLAYEHPNKYRDYWLVGRWKEESEDTQEME